MPRLSEDRAWDLLVAAAAEDPRHRDPSVTDGRTPRYLHNGQPTCLVALVLVRAGVPAAVLRRANRTPIAALHTVAMTRRARELLAEAQANQDAGCTWGLAVERTARRHGRALNDLPWT